MSFAETIGASAENLDALPGFFARMSSPSMQGAYVVFDGSDGERRPQVVLPSGAVKVFECLQAVETFAADHQLDASDRDELLAMMKLGVLACTKYFSPCPADTLGGF